MVTGAKETSPQRQQPSKTMGNNNTNPDKAMRAKSAAGSPQQRRKSQPQARSQSTPRTATINRKNTSGGSSNGGSNRHRLDRFGFIVNIDANGQVTDLEDDYNMADSNSSDTSTLHTSRQSAPFKTKQAVIHNDNDAERVFTFAEHQRVQRRAKKWDAMMGRWAIPEQKSNPIAAIPNIIPVLGNNNTKKRRSQSLPPPQRGASSSSTSSTTPNSNLSASSSTKKGIIHRRKVVTRLRKGVPDHLRGQVWQYLARVPQKLKQHKGLYNRLVQQAIDQHLEAAQHFEYIGENNNGPQQKAQQSNSNNKEKPALVPTPSMIEHAKSFKSIQDTIERDIHRTYPRHHLFYESEDLSDSDEPVPLELPRSNSSSVNGIASATKKQSSSLSLPSSPNRTDDKSNSNNNDTLRSSSADEKDDTLPPLPKSLLQHNPSLQRSVSPPESPYLRSAAASAVSSTTDVDESNNGLDDDDDDDYNDRFQTVVGGFCGNEEISNMIRELEGVVAGEQDGTSKTTVAAPPTSSSAQQQPAAQIPPPDRRQNYSLNGPVLPARVADAVGGQASLRRVLKAYSVYDREIGYCQGMNFVAGMFLTLMPEEEAFWLLVSVMNEEPCRMRGLFGEGMRETHLVLHVAERLIQLHLPKVYNQLEREHVHITMFATQWLLTQYTSSFRFDLVLRVWDAFLGEGWKITYRVMLALLKLHETELLHSSFEDVLALVRELPDRVNGNTVLETALQIPLRRQTIQKLEAEWNIANQPQQRQQTSTTAGSSSSAAAASSKKKKTIAPATATITSKHATAASPARKPGSAPGASKPPQTPKRTTNASSTTSSASPTRTSNGSSSGSSTPRKPTSATTTTANNSKNPTTPQKKTNNSNTNIGSPSGSTIAI